MKSVTVPDKNPAEILKIVLELKNRGWVKGVDFDFAYHRVDPKDYLTEKPSRYTVFTFYTEEYSTYFALRYI